MRASKSSRLCIAAIALGVLSLSHTPGWAQGVSALNLEAPILPQDIAAPIASSAGPVGTSVVPSVAQTSFVGCTSCGSVGCTGCDDCGPGFACSANVGVWIRADYLVWYEKNMDTIPLATTSSGIPVVNPDNLLDLDATETSVLFGGRSLNGNSIDGWRLEVGTWLDANATYGLFGRYYEAGNRSHSFSSNSDQIGFLGIPFFNSDANQEDAIELAVPNERIGALDIEIDGSFRSWEILFRRLAQTGSNYRMDWVYGYRNTRLHDSINLNAATLNVIDIGLTPADTAVSLRDTFDAKNQFHGIDLGITGQSQEGCWSLDFMLKVALGVIDQEVTVGGNQITDGPTGRAVNVGGLFSQETNLGKNDQSEFGFIPEFDINLGYAITPNMDFTVGYTFIFMNSVVRSGTAIDRVIDPGLLVDLDPANSSRPQVNFDDDSYYIHGLNIGMTARF